MANSSEVQRLLGLLAAAIQAGDSALAAQLISQINDLIYNGVESEDKGTIVGGYETQNTPLNPTQPHGEQPTQRSHWDFAGVRCGRCTRCPRYWKLTFDFAVNNADENSDSFAELFGDIPVGDEGWFGDKPYESLKYWFVPAKAPESGPTVILKRGPMVRRPLGGSQGSLQEAIQKRFVVEYERCFWKHSIANTTYTDMNVGNQNVAWFLYYADIVRNDDEEKLNTDSHVATDFETPIGEDVPHKGWVLALVENERVKPGTGGRSWVNAYPPLVEYELCPRTGNPFQQPEAPSNDDEEDTRFFSTFNCLGPNRFYSKQKWLPVPDHIVTVEPYWP